eukprot:764046-Hanusia_phi.AAC.2
MSSNSALIELQVKDRANAQSSCAGIFIHQHLPKDFQGQWLHVDMAGPAFVVRDDKHMRGVLTCVSG